MNCSSEDIIILLDTNSGISEIELLQMKIFIKNIINIIYHRNDSNLRLGLITFNNDSQILLNIGNYGNNTNIKNTLEYYNNMIDSIEISQNTTMCHIESAIVDSIFQFANYPTFNNNNNNNEKRQKQLFIITTNDPSSDLCIYNVTLLKTLLIDVSIVLIGSSPAFDEFACIVKNESNSIYETVHSSRLILNSNFEFIANRLCHPEGTNRVFMGFGVFGLVLCGFQGFYP